MAEPIQTRMVSSQTVSDPICMDRFSRQTVCHMAGGCPAKLAVIRTSLAKVHGLICEGFAGGQC